MAAVCSTSGAGHLSAPRDCAECDSSAPAMHACTAYSVPAHRTHSRQRRRTVHWTWPQWLMTVLLAIVLGLLSSTLLTTGVNAQSMYKCIRMHGRVRTHVKHRGCSWYVRKLCCLLHASSCMFAPALLSRRCTARVAIKTLDQAHKNALSRTHARRCTRAHARTRTPPRTRTCTRTCVQAQANAKAHGYARARAPPHPHARRTHTDRN